MAEVHSLSTTDASNTARFPENQAPSTLNNGARALEGMLARFDRDNDGSLTTGGTTTAYTVTLNSQHSAWFTGLRFRAKLDQTCGATPTINPTGSAALGAKSLYTTAGAAVASGALIGGGIYDFVYDGTNVQVVNSKGGDTSGAASSTDNALVRFNGTDGKTLQNSVATLDDNGSVVISGSTTGLDLTKADDSANGVFLLLYQNSASPAANDLMGLVRWSGNSSLGTKRTYGQFLLSASDVTDASEDGLWTIQTMSAGTLANRVLCGAGWYMSGQADPGAGNMGAAAYYINGRLVYPAGCWGKVSVSGGTPTLDDSHNVTSITDTDVGELTVTIATDHANDDYAIQATVGLTGSTTGVRILGTPAVGSFVIQNGNNAGGEADPSFYYFATFGDI